MYSTSKSMLYIASFTYHTCVRIVLPWTGGIVPGRGMHSFKHPNLSGWFQELSHPYPFFNLMYHCCIYIHTLTQIQFISSSVPLSHRKQILIARISSPSPVSFSVVFNSTQNMETYSLFMSHGRHQLCISQIS